MKSPYGYLGDMISVPEVDYFMYKLVSTVRGGAVNSAAVTVNYKSVDEAREAAKLLMHEHQRVVRVMIVEASDSRFVEWMDRS